MDTGASHRASGAPGAAFDATPGVTGSLPPSSVSDLETREASFLAPFERVFATLKRMASNYATLAVLDVRRAALQLAWLVAGGVFISVLLVTAWLAIVVAIAVALFGAGMSWPGVLLVAAGLNVVGAVLFGMRLKAVFKHVPFEATLRQIKSDPDKLGTK